MSVYTTELRYIIESGYDLKLTDYPIFDESYRNVLNKKIIDHYYFREIGFETAALFANRLRCKLNEIMPYYNQLYKSALLEFDPLLNEDVTEKERRDYSEDSDGTNTDEKTMKGTSQGDSSSSSQTGTEESGKGTQAGSSSGTESSTDTTSSLTISSDTPQGFLSTQSLEDGTWATTASKSTGENHHSGDTTSEQSGVTTDERTVNSTQKATQTDLSSFDNEEKGSGSTHETKGGWEDIERKISARRGASAPQLLLEFRQTFLNIDMQVIADLEKLFMGVWK